MSKKSLLAFTAVLFATLGSPLARAEQSQVPDSLDLRSAIRYALENNFAIRQARERIKEREGVEIEVRSQQLPKVASSISYSRNADEITRYAGDQDRDWGIALTASQTLYAGGGVTASVSSSRLLREAALLELQGIINEQLLLVRTRYYNVLLYRQRISVQEQNIKLLEEQLKNARNRFEAGVTSNFETLRAEVSLANGRPPFIQAKNDYRIAIQELRQSLGFVNDLKQGGDHIPDILGSLDVGTLETVQLSDALSAARSNRPELQRIGKLAESGEQGLAIARAGYLPKVSAFGRYDFARGSTDSAWGQRRDGWTAGLQASWDVFDGRATAGRVSQARSRINQLKLQQDEAILSVEVEVRRAHSALQQAWELVEATGKVVSQAEEALRLANVRYSAGTATQLDVLTSQVALTEARLNQLQTYHGYNVALASLRKATGQADSYIAGP